MKLVFVNSVMLSQWIKNVQVKMYTCQLSCNSCDSKRLNSLIHLVECGQWYAPGMKIINKTWNNSFKKKCLYQYSGHIWYIQLNNLNCKKSVLKVNEQAII